MIITNISWKLKSHVCIYIDEHLCFFSFSFSKLIVTFIDRIIIALANDIALWLRINATFVQDLGSVPNLQMSAKNCLELQFQWLLYLLLASLDISQHKLNMNPRIQSIHKCKTTKPSNNNSHSHFQLVAYVSSLESQYTCKSIFSVFIEMYLTYDTEIMCTVYYKMITKEVTLVHNSIALHRTWC